MNKLKRKHKKETRGAVRELRKDNYFVTTEKQKRRKLEDEVREKKRKIIMSQLESQQADAKKLQREREKTIGTKKTSAF